jgi:hypothetical protein
MGTFDDITKEIRSTAEGSRRWAEDGWPMTFGRPGRAVSSLGDANALEEAFVNRIEAVAYWRRVEEAGTEAATWAERAAAALDRGDIADADDSLYFALFLERPLRSTTPVWGPVYRKFKERAQRKAETAR